MSKLEHSNRNNPEFYIQGLLKGDITVLGRAITLVESVNPIHQTLAQSILDAIHSKTGSSFRLAITGVPGVGKSTFINAFGKLILEKGHKLAVLAIDPSSSITRGSILGDKTRMDDLVSEKNVFIRPSPSGGSLGGVAKRTYETMLLCEAAGFDFIIIETVGVGQSETAVKNLCDFFMLLMLAGAGDELQGIKRGIMEMADALIVTKADGENITKAKAAALDYSHAMHYLQKPDSGWSPKVTTASGTTGEGMPEIFQMMRDYRELTMENRYFAQQRKNQIHALMIDAVGTQLEERFFSDPQVAAKMAELNAVSNFQPFALAKKLIDVFFDKNCQSK